MALVFMDGFDCYGTNGQDISGNMVAAGWVQYGNSYSDQTSSSNTRSGLGQCMALVTNAPSTHDIRINLPALPEFFFGFAMNLNRYDQPGVQMFFHGLYDNSFGTTWENFQLFVADNGAITAVSNGAVLATSEPGVVQNYAWHYLEGHVVVDGTAGSIAISIDGSQVLSVTGVATKNPASPSKVNQLGFYSSYGNGGEGLLVDDFYVCDTTGSSLNSYLGDNIVYGVLPNGDGGTNAMTQVGGTVAGHYTSINELSPDGDTSYLTSNTPGTTELFTIPNLPAAALDVLAVQVHADARREAGGIAKIQMVISDGTNTVSGDAKSVPNTYATRSQIFENAPDGGAWTVAKVNEPLRVGVKVSA